MKINDEGPSNAAHWHERAMKAEARLQKIMARCADLLDEDQFNELDAMTRAADPTPSPQPAGVTSWMCTCGKANSEYRDRCENCGGMETWTRATDPTTACNHFPGQSTCEWCRAPAAPKCDCVNDYERALCSVCSAGKGL